MDAGKRTLNDIFNGNRILEIPFFQRAYVWGEEQWERLAEDMETVTDDKKPYFLGSVIFKQQETDTSYNVGDIRTLIDGQQRLTTLNIFFKVLCLKKGENSSFNRMFVLENDDLALLHNHNDIKAFTAILKLENIEKLTGNNNITQAYNYFVKRIDIEKVDRQSLLNNIMFVGIDLSMEEDEQQIFDTINSLGVRLTTAELLKNYFFNRTELEAYNEFWKDVFEKNAETKEYWDKEITTGRLRRTFIDIFFYSYLQIKIQESNLNVNAKDKNDFSKVEKLFESYKSFIKGYDLDKKEILTEIKQYALLFRENFDHEIINNELTNEYGIERINAIIFGLDTSTLIPYILFILKNVQESAQKKELFQFIEAYIMRRIVVKATTKNYNLLFTDRVISNKILTKDQFINYLSKSSEKVNYLPSDQELEDGFNDSKLINKQSAGVVYFIESMIRDRNKQATQLLGLNKYSLEHLMPKKWENNWGQLASQEEVDYRNRILLTVGNLAIITKSLNASIRDSDWNMKKSGTKKKEGLRHFSAGIETLSPYLELSNWDESEIKKRATNLLEMALDIWQISN